MYTVEKVFQKPDANGINGCSLPYYKVVIDKEHHVLVSFQPTKFDMTIIQQAYVVPNSDGVYVRDENGESCPNITVNPKEAIDAVYAYIKGE